MSAPEQELVAQAQAIYAGHGNPMKLRAAFDRATLLVKGEFSDRLSIPVTSVPGMGTWLCAFSNLEWLARIHGPCDYFSTTGEDLMANVVPDLDAQISGVFLDVGADHQLAFPREPSVEVAS